MNRPFLSRVFSLGPLAPELRAVIMAEYAPVEITELPWDPDSTEPPETQAARLYLAFEQAGGVSMTLGERIICLPRSVAPLVFFLTLVNRGDWGTPRILISDEPDVAQQLRVLASDTAILPLRELRAGKETR
jgi:hypothetical protein